jgi:hypothetical protein
MRRSGFQSEVGEPIAGSMRLPKLVADFLDPATVNSMWRSLPPMGG